MEDTSQQGLFPPPVWLMGEGHFLPKCRGEWFDAGIRQTGRPPIAAEAVELEVRNS